MTTFQIPPIRLFLKHYSCGEQGDTEGEEKLRTFSSKNDAEMKPLDLDAQTRIKFFFG